MKIIECIYFFLLFCLCIVTSVSDIRKGLIRNKTLMIFALIGLLLDVIYYGFMARDILWIYIINLCVVMIIGIILFYTHSFAGGDCKLVSVIAILYPANCYLTYGKSQITLFFAIGLAILYGYLYLLGMSVLKLIQGKNKMTLSNMMRYVRNYIISFCSALVYISFINLIVVILNNFLVLNNWFIRILCMVITYMVTRISVLKKWYVLVPMIILDVVMGTVLKIIPFSIAPENYLLVIVLLICQMTIKTNLYEEVEITKLKKGMILSTVSSALMQNIWIKGMPCISSEDLRSRLTEKEIISIGKWGESKNITTVIIVKKIPFAIFLSLGFLTYYIIWRWLL